MTFEEKKSSHNFYCKKCDYLCRRTTDYNKHLLTRKHKMMTNDDTNDDAKNLKYYKCENCEKTYSYRQGLYVHKKKCKIDKNITNTEISLENTNKQLETTDKDLVMLLIKENSELKNMMMEVIKTGTHNTYNTNNSNNKTFNLQVFLNETCKDAMNIMDFVNSMEIDLNDLEKVGELGYVNGMTNIILHLFSFKTPTSWA